MKWPITTIGKVCISTSQKDPSKTHNEGWFRYVDIAGIDRSSKIISSAKQVPCSEAPSRARKVLKTDDVLVSMVRPNLNAVAQVPKDLDGEIASTGFSVLRANPKLVNPKFLFYRTQHRDFIDYLVSKCTGQSYPAVSDEIIRNAPISLPPLSEQERIVEILEEANRIRRLRKEANQKAEKIIPALFLKMFGDPETNPKGWKIQHIKDVVLSTDYATSSKASSDGLGLPIIRMGNIDYEGRLDLKDLKYIQLEHAEIERLSLKAGDILFNRTNSKELVGKTGLWDGGIEAVPASYFIRVRVNPDIITPCFLWVFMNSNHMKKLLFSTARGAIGQANINSRELKDFSIFIPLIDKQKLFENMLEKIKRLIHHQSESLLKSENLFSMLLMQSFSGRK